VTATTEIYTLALPHSLPI